MPTIADIMTTDVQLIGPEESLQRAAQMMDQLNVGSLPVCSGGRLLGIVTDRDITIRGTAAGLTPAGACVSDVMSRDVRYCTADQDIAEALRTMADAQVRRVPVVEGDGLVVGIVALGDLATRQRIATEDTLRDISAPSSPAGGTGSS